MQYHGGVQVQPSGSSEFVTLPLPPSTNARMGVFRGMQLLSRVARKWAATVEPGLREWLLLSPYTQPIDEYTFVDLWFVLPRSNCDNHNYFKCLFDALEKSGVVTDDKYLIPRVQGVGHDSKQACVVLRIVR